MDDNGVRNLIYHLNLAIEIYNNEIRDLRRLIFRACAELETVEYENDPPERVVALMDDLRAVNRNSLLPPNVELRGRAL